MHYSAKIQDIYKYVKLRENSSNQTPEKKFGPFSWKQSGRSKEQVKVILTKLLKQKYQPFQQLLISCFSRATLC